MLRYARKSLFHSVAVTAAVVSLLAAAPDSSRAQQQEGTFYYSDGKRIPLTPADDTVAVRFKAGGKAAPDLSPASRAAVGTETHLTKHRLVLYRLRQGASPAEAVTLRSDLSRDPTVELVAPVFAVRGGKAIVTEQFVARFASDISESRIDAINAAGGVEIVEKFPWQENTYILRVRSGDALSTANRYHEMEEVIYAHPDFVHVMKKNGAALPGSGERLVIGPSGEILPPDTAVPKGSFDYRVRERGFDQRSVPEETAHSGPSGSVSRTILGSQDFEGAFPGGSWTSMDYSGVNSGTWAKTADRKFAGTYSAYCTGTVTPAPGPYSPNAYAWLVYGPFSLAGAVDARVTMKAYSKTEVGADYLKLTSSSDGNAFGGWWFSGDWTDGSDGGWHNFGLSLNEHLGDSTVWIAVIFDSDSGIADIGSWVDDIVVEKITGGYENLTSDAFEHLQWSLNNTGQTWGTPDADIDALSAWPLSKGSGVTVAVIDEGVDLGHPDLTVLSGYDATDRSFGGAAQGDDAHGTNCAGIVAATSNNGIGVAGVAPMASVLPVRIAYGDGSGGWVFTSTWAAGGIGWAWNNGADVLSNSWYSYPPTSVITTAIADARTSGRGGLGSVVVFSAGNDDGALNYPATLDTTLAVGASSPCDERKSPASCDAEEWWGSNFGAELDLVAPGVLMYSTDIQGAAGYSTDDYTPYFNGTSSAAPVAAGTAALLMALRPDLTAGEVEAALVNTADDIGPTGWDQWTGAGRVNAAEALKSVDYWYRTSIDLGGGWRWFDWFGSFNVSLDPWVYHPQHQYLYPFGTTPENITFWDNEMGAFWWTSESSYPYVYRYADSQWLWYCENCYSAGTRWFSLVPQGTWESY